MGDFNAQNTIWGSSHTNGRGQLIERILLDLPLTIVSTGRPTHFHAQTNSYSTIDLTICSSEIADSFNYNVIQDLHTSDHFPILLSWKEAPITHQSVPRYNIKTANWTQFDSLTETYLANQNNLHVDQHLNLICESIISAAERSIPKTSGLYTKPPVPWWNEDCRLARRERIRAERALRRNHTIENKIRFQRARAVSIQTFNTARKISFQSFVQSINQRCSLHKIWKRVRKIEGKFSPTPNPVLLSNGNLHSKPEDCAEILANHFSSISDPTNYSAHFQAYRQIQERTNLNFRSASFHSYNSPISETELSQALAKCKESSPGADNITYSMLKHCHSSLHSAILELFNKIYSTGTFPQAWRSSIVIPIAKPNKDPQSPTNYRPIALTNTLCKLMEKIVNARLMWVLESRNLITPEQAGFRKNRSTTDHLVQIETTLKTNLSRKLHTIAVFFDLTKAYDMSWRYGLLKVLHDFGFRGSLPMFISNFLTDRSIKVRVGAALSQSHAIQEGIPQGSVLSCTCFLLAINSISSQMPPTTQSLLYVDDFTILCSGQDVNRMQRQLQLALNNLSRWSTRTGFIFSESKTVSMHFCRKKNCPKTAPLLTLNNSPITCVDTTKFLGLTLDNSLTWKQHITTVKSKAQKTLDLFKKLAHSKWGSDTTTLLRLYIMLLKPLTEYGMEAYYSAADTYLKSIYCIQNAALRIAAGAFRTSPIDSLHAITSMLPPKYAADLKQLNYYLRLHVNPIHPMRASLLDQDNLHPDTIAEHFPKKSYLSRAHNLHLDYQLNSETILPEPIPEEPPWQLTINLCKDLYQYKKGRIPDNILREIYHDHLTSHQGSLQIYTDGSKSNTGVGYAYHCPYRNASKHIPSIATIYTAELMAILDAIQYVNSADLQQQYVTIISDSRCALQAIASMYPTNPIVQHIQSAIISSSKSFSLCWVPSHIGVAGNERVDGMAAAAIENLPETITPLPRSDIKLHLKRSARTKWQRDWSTITNNKLKESLPSIPPKYSNLSNRSWSIKLTRLQIGHTQLTHEHLLTNDPIPYCEDCIVPLTIKHLLIECPSHLESRDLFGCPGPPQLHDVFRSENCLTHGPLYSFLLSIGIINKI